MSEPNKKKLQTPFTTESGFIINEPEAAYHYWGALNEAKDNVILICHALTGNSDAKDWFSGFFASDGIIDPNRHFVICINSPGSCYGSSGPWSLNPETNKPYRADFSVLTIRDIVRFQGQLLSELGITGIELVIGGSMGGMIALEFSIMDKRVRSVGLLAMGKAHTPWAIGISNAQRQALYADEKWNGGWYDKSNPPKKGLSAARAMAMITYRAPQNYEQKFGRDFNQSKDKYEVESYLEYQGQKLVNRFDALSYDLLSKSMDTHDVSRDRGSFEEALGSITVPTLVIGIDTDLLYPPYEQKELAALIPNGIYREIKSPYGHDAFLIEFEQINSFLKEFLNKNSKSGSPV
jgi:homoserine O-acetyltransferase